ncbi:MAG: toll/interleukin-1 receptor domain-containing protein [Flavobacteriales bacterium]|nr:toll/interleukin-1 receptor domain-containing protein [Flavobacteriales bacterium]
MEKQYRYDIAISYAEEDKANATEFAERFRSSGLHVFFDEFESFSLHGKPLIEVLHKIYTTEARYCVPLISSIYINKPYAKHEMHSALTRAIKENTEYILPIMIDEISVPGLHDDIKWLSLKRLSVIEIVSQVLQKLNLEMPDRQHGARTDIKFDVHSSVTSLTASIVAFGNRSQILAIVNQKGVFISSDLGVTATLMIQGDTQLINDIGFSFDDSLLVLHSNKDVYVLNIHTKELMHVFGDADSIQVISNSALQLDGDSMALYPANFDDILLFDIAVDRVKQSISENKKPKGTAKGDRYKILSCKWNPAQIQFSILIRQEYQDNDKWFFSILIYSFDKRTGFVLEQRKPCKEIIEHYTVDSTGFNIMELEWNPNGRELGIITQGADLRGLMVWDIPSDKLYTIFNIRPLTDIFWIDLFKLLLATSGAGINSLTVFDLRDKTEKIIEKTGAMYSITVSSSAHAIFYSQMDMRGAIKVDEDEYLVQLLNKNYSFPVFKTKKKVQSVSWSHDDTYLAVCIESELFILGLPRYIM